MLEETLTTNYLKTLRDELSVSCFVDHWYGRQNIQKNITNSYLHLG